MSQIFDSLKGLITPELISKAASSLGEDDSKVTSAVTSLVPSILGSLLAKGDSKDVASALTEAGNQNSNILSNITNIFSGSSDDATSNIGSKFITSLFGDKIGGLTSLISSVSGVSSGGVGKLISSISPIVAGFLGDKMNSGGMNLSGLLQLLNKEKGSFLGLIPSGLGSLFGLSSLAGLGTNLASGISSGVNSAEKKVEEAASKGSSFLKWLIPLLLILAVLFFVWKSCSKTATDVVEDTAATVTGTASDAVNSGVDKINDAIERISTELTLPNGLKLNAFKDGMEDQLINFVQSDDYKNATDESLKEKWFRFDNIQFTHGSSTELTPESYKQLDNIAAILKAYPDIKVKIGGYTDKTGDAQVNKKISQERANTIRNILGKNGVTSQVVDAEGYGDEFAQYPADAPDSDRASDRKISIRLVK